MKPVSWLSSILLYGLSSSAQSPAADSNAFDYSKIYSYALDANIRPAILLVASSPSPRTSEDRQFKAAFASRFMYTADSSLYPSKSNSINDLVDIYKDYWRKSLLDTASSYDTLLAHRLGSFLAARYPGAGLNKTPSARQLDQYLVKYLQSQQLHTTGYGKTGRLYDLLVWRTQRDTVYKFSLPGDTTMEPVTFMDDFITLGWEEYATLGKYYPGGWTKPQSLYCVVKSYDLTSEHFLVSYLAHESRHYKDYKLFPRLGSPDLEYRAKLTELSLAKTSLYQLIGFFIANANSQSGNGHEIANYCVIRDLSRRLFNKPFENDTAVWKNTGAAAINQVSAAILGENTLLLQKQGKKVASYILAHPVLF